MNRSACVIAVLALCLSFPGAAAEDSLADSFRAITKSTRWRSVDEIPLRFDTHHTQGMTVVGERIFLSSVEVVNRAKGLGTGHLFETGFDGKLRRSIVLGEGPAYHPGGIDYDGKRIWVSVAEYRPDSSSVVYTVAPDTLQSHRVFTFNDHLGAIAHDRQSKTLIAVSWGARRIYKWETVKSDRGWQPINPDEPLVLKNPNHYIDYQDCQILPRSSLILFSGLSRYRAPAKNGSAFALGGIDLMDFAALRLVHQVAVPVWTQRDLPMTQNPFYVVPAEAGLRFYFAPEDNETTLFVYETSVRRESPPTP